jgi:hypothetical protein
LWIFTPRKKSGDWPGAVWPNLLHDGERRGLVSPGGLVADFVIGAHALLRSDRLLTLDARLYKQDFPDLEIITCD